MKLTNAEKLIISMLADLHVKLDINKENAEFINEAILRDQTWALSWELSGIVADSPDQTPAAVKEVMNFLEMWTHLEAVKANFNDDQKQAFDALWGGSSEYVGFDGNNEPEQKAIAGFVVNYMDRFENFKGRSNDSHAPSLERYRKIYQAYVPVRPRLASGAPLGVDELVKILKAGSPQ